MDWEKIINESIKNWFHMMIPILTSEPMIVLYTGIIVSKIVSFVVNKLSYGYFRITGDSRRKAKKKSNLLNDLFSL